MLKPIVEHRDGRYRAVCRKCEYQSADFRDEQFAHSLLDRHCNTRKHKTNMRSPNRFTS